MKDDHHPKYEDRSTGYHIHDLVVLSQIASDTSCKHSYSYIDYSSEPGKAETKQKVWKTLWYLIVYDELRGES